jgi:hypothetical protein
VAVSADQTPVLQPAAPAPFGLEWALSRKAVEARGIRLTQMPSSKGSQLFLAEGLTKLVGDIETVLVDFGFDDRLWRVVGTSKSYPNDPFGFKVRSRFSEINQALRDKYGEGEEIYETTGGIYEKLENFIPGIQKYKNFHYSLYGNHGIEVELSIRAENNDTGYWVIIYKNSELKENFEESRINKEKNAL